MKIIFLLFCVTTTITNVNSHIKTAFRHINLNFTCALTDVIAQGNSKDNVVLSAFSLLPLLGQLSAAAVADSQYELLKWLGFSDDESVKAVFRYMFRKFEEQNDFKFTMANKLYIAQDVRINPNFTALSKSDFRSNIENINFNSSSAVNEINSWVRSESNNRFSGLFSNSDLEPPVRIALANTLSFKSDWDNPFPTSQTSDVKFYTSEKSSVMIPFMNKTDYVNYTTSHELDAQILQLPYQGKKASLIVVLSNNMKGLNKLLHRLSDYKMLIQEFNHLSRTSVKISLPKFTIETTTNLVDRLRQVKITKIFEPREAKFYKMLYDKDNYLKNEISAAKQMAAIVVDEAGSDAINSNVYVPPSSTSMKLETFCANRPFVFYVMYDRIAILSGVFRG